MKTKTLKKIIPLMMALSLVFAMLIVPISADFSYNYDPTTQEFSNVVYDPVKGEAVYETTIVTIENTGEQVDLKNFYEVDILEGGFWAILDPGATFLSTYTNSRFIEYIVINGKYYVYDTVIQSDGNYEYTLIYDTSYRKDFDATVDDVKFIAIAYPWDYYLTIQVANRWGNNNDNVNANINFDVYDIVSASANKPSSPDTDSIVGTWGGALTWIVTALGAVTSIFYANGSLTLIGTLSIVGVSIAIIFLIIALIQRFLHLRG